MWSCVNGKIKFDKLHKINELGAIINSLRNTNSHIKYYSFSGNSRMILIFPNRNYIIEMKSSQHYAFAIEHHY